MSAPTGFVAGSAMTMTVPSVTRQRRMLCVALPVVASFLAACSGTESTFRRVDLPAPAWFSEKLAETCVARSASKVAEVLRESGASELVSSGDAPCVFTADTSGGGAVVDFSGDGLPDVIWTSSVLGPAVFLENLGGFRFKDVSEKVAPGVDLSFVNGVAAGDVDRDGNVDLFFMGFARTSAVLLMGNKDGTFRDESVLRGLDMDVGVSQSGGSAVFADYDNDGWLDLHTTESRLVELQDRSNPGHARLMRNLGGSGRPGVFEDVTESAGVVMRQATGSVLTFVSTFHDFNQDGFLDLFIISDFNTSRLFLNNGDGTFRDGYSEFPITDEESGMGVAIGDVTGDGQPEVFVVAASQFPLETDETRTCQDVDPVSRRYGFDGTTGNALFSFDTGELVELTDRYGVRHGGWGWGASMYDYDNDGGLDIVMVGSINSIITAVKTYCNYADTFQSVVRLFRNEGGSMRDVSASLGFVLEGLLKSPLSADFDGDGDADLIVFRSHGAPVIFENRLDVGGLGVTVRFSGEELLQNARIRVSFTDGSQPIIRYAGVQNGLFTANFGDEIIGLGARAAVLDEVYIEYRSGRKILLENVRAGEVLVVP